MVGLLLAAASVTGGLGAAVLLGLLVEVALSRRWRWLWSIVVGALPIVAWYAGEAANTATHPGQHLPHLPWWAVKYLTAAAGAVFGLPLAGGIAVILLGVAAISLWRRAAPGRAASLFSPRAIGLLLTLAGAVVSIGIARAADTPATTSRYLYFPVIVIVLLACEWCRGLAIPRPRATAVVAAAMVAVAVGLGVHQLRHGKAFYLSRADGSAARMGAMLLASGPRVVIEPGGLAYTPAVLRTFVGRFGSAPIDSAPRLARALPESRAAVDQVLAAADVQPARALRSCRRLSAGAALPRRDTVILIADSRPGSAQLLRYAEPGAGAVFAVAPPRVPFALRQDSVPRPWRLLLPATATARVCAY
jgi:hypothetical protein